MEDKKRFNTCKECKREYLWGYDIEDYNSVETYGVCKQCEPNLTYKNHGDPYYLQYSQGDYEDVD